ncbi:MAG: DUF3800 domain-containing protein [Methanobrevibacter sp.]|jgi:hypothetical protein|nr:DUF3800 domain-containing protein [Methanobrevibacter sp.]
MNLIYVDESGDLGKLSHCFIIASLELNSLKTKQKLEKIVKKARKCKFKNKLKNKRELKGNSLSKDIISYFLKSIANEDINIHLIVFDKNNYKNIHFLKNEGVNKTYSKILVELISKSNIDYEFKLIIDKFLHKRHQKPFHEKILLDLKFDKKVEICQKPSEKSILLQLVDLIAWATFQKFERNNTEYLDILNKKIVNIIIK